MYEKRVILASGSPRRKELMKMITDSFEVHVSDCEEIITSDVPSEVTKELAKQKAEAVFKEILQKEKRVPCNWSRYGGQPAGKKYTANQKTEKMHLLCCRVCRGEHMK